MSSKHCSDHRQGPRLSETRPMGHRAVTDLPSWRTFSILFLLLEVPSSRDTAPVRMGQVML